LQSILSATVKIYNAVFRRLFRLGAALLESRRSRQGLEGTGSTVIDDPAASSFGQSLPSALLKTGIGIGFASPGPPSRPTAWVTRRFKFSFASGPRAHDEELRHRVDRSVLQRNGPDMYDRIGKSTGRTFFSRHSLALQARADPRQGYTRNHLPGPARRLVR
jgi:hypothetical protein